MLITSKPQTKPTDQVLKEYIFLKEQAEFIAERLDSLKELLTQVGTCSSENYVCLVGTRQRTVGPNKKTLEALLGPEVYAENCHKIEYTTVSVKRKH